MSKALEIADYRYRVEEIYAEWRRDGDGRSAWKDWRRRRDLVLATHPQSVKSGDPDFRQMPFYEYDPSWRLTGTWVDVDPEPWGEFHLVGRLEIHRGDWSATLNAYWLDTYGGGLFVPFGDQTNGESTYGGGRYLIDSAKGAYLGSVGNHVLMDFNGGYHPSCAHDPAWECPLSPPENRLPIRVEAGERL